MVFYTSFCPWGVCTLHMHVVPNKLIVLYFSHFSFVSCEGITHKCMYFRAPRKQKLKKNFRMVSKCNHIKLENEIIYYLWPLLCVLCEYASTGHPCVATFIFFRNPTFSKRHVWIWMHLGRKGSNKQFPVILSTLLWVEFIFGQNIL